MPSNTKSNPPRPTPQSGGVIPPPPTGAPATADVGGRDDVRTPWGRVRLADADAADIRDPFEPDAPLSAAEAAAAARRPARRPAGPGTADDPAPLTPRELYEMLMTPAAHPTRSSPARHASAARPAGAGEGGGGSSGGGGGGGGGGGERRHPPQADLIRSAMAVGRAADPAAADRRRSARRPYRVRGDLRLFSDAPDARARPIYTVDAHARGIGFVTEHRLPLGYGGTVELPDPAGGDAPVRVNCTLIRCREAAPGWFEGSLCFNREQPAFDAV